MADEISPELFIHLVELAALELSPDEAEYLRNQLNNQLKAIHELEAIPLDPSTPIATHGIAYSEASRPPIRPDEWVQYADPAGIVAGAPKTEEGYFVVPEIPHTDLD